MTNLVDHGSSHRHHHLFFALASAADWILVDGDAVWKCTGVGPASCERYSLVEAQEVVGVALIFDHDGDIGHSVSELAIETQSPTGNARYRRFARFVRIGFEQRLGLGSVGLARPGNCLTFDSGWELTTTTCARFHRSGYRADVADCPRLQMSTALWKNSLTCCYRSWSIIEVRYFDHTTAFQAGYAGSIPVTRSLRRSLAMLPPSSAGLNREEAMRLLAQLQEMDQRVRDLRAGLTALRSENVARRGGVIAEARA